jgi:hypothetical protein
LLLLLLKPHCGRIFRRRCLAALQTDIESELKFCTETAAHTPKNYQLWHHRRELVEIRGTPGDELAVTREILTKDQKNYHVWVHRQWVLRRFGIWDAELAYVDLLLRDDIRNNSAWSHRWLCVSHGAPLPGTSKPHSDDQKIEHKDSQLSGLSKSDDVETGSPLSAWTSDILAREIKYASDAIGLCPNNDAPWRYLEGSFAFIAVLILFTFQFLSIYARYVYL